MIITAIMIKAIADRLAEAFAEHLHELVRKKYWGYSPEEEFSNEDLIKESYQRNKTCTRLSCSARSY